LYVFSDIGDDTTENGLATRISMNGNSGRLDVRN
jgi:hypothetical protein